MGIALLLLGYLIGATWLGPPNGGVVGLVFALLIWMILSLVSYFNGDSIMLTMSGAKQVTPDVHPQLFNVVEEMKIAAGLPAMPKVYIIDDPAPNAFATGRKPEKCAIAVTAGLLARLNRDELQGVVAHETAHILNRDILFITFAGVMLGSIVLISQIFLRGSLYGAMAGGRHRSRSSRGGGGQGALAIIAIVLAILAPIMAQLLYFAISRRREYLADASAARLTRYPEGLAAALEKISTSKTILSRQNKVTAPLYIVNPLRKRGREATSLSSTHPPITERIRILRSMAGGAGLNNYQEAYSQVTGARSSLIPPSALHDKAAIPIRTAAAGDKADVRAQGRELGDLMKAVNQFAFLVCVCGLKIKVPPDFKKKAFPCPRCGRQIKIPVAELAAAAAVMGGIKTAGMERTYEKAKEAEATYHRQGKGWESFSCSCGKIYQLSPGFTGDHITCGNCDRRINIIR